jgi:hypothetical protein
VPISGNVQVAIKAIRAAHGREASERKGGE